MNMMDWVGQTLGKYRIEAPLDAGGMGQVFRGTHMYLNRPAAIKIMKATLADNPSFRTRFLQEAQAAANLKHPNIVDIYDFDEQNGYLYLAMELMTDGSMSTLLLQRNSGKPWPLSLGLELMRQAAEGLAAAHTRGMVHRDIKPGNLLLNRVNRAGSAEQYQLKISDFGLAKLAAGSGLTAAGEVMGTPAYMSPEQCQAGRLDGRSDLYSLGIVLYQIATGLLPFQINTMEDALQKHVNETPPPPRQVRSDVPPLVEEIILRCLAKKPADRYATGTELAQALREALNDKGLKTVTSIRLPPLAAGKTVMQPRVFGDTLAPNVVTLPGTSPLPRVRVLNQSGQTLQAADVTLSGITIGRQSDCDIVLQEQGVSRQHLRVTWDGIQVTVTDLGSSNGTQLGETRMLPQTSQPWMPRQIIRIGSLWLRLEGQNVQTTPPMLNSGSQTQLRDATIPHRSHRASSMVANGDIGVIAEPDALTITPGQPATLQVSIVNLGSIVDWFTVTVEGVAPEWAQGSSQAVQLNPGLEQAVILNVNVTRTANNHAGDYPVTIRARSRAKPDETGTAQVHLTVLPFKENELTIAPSRVVGKGKAAYTLMLRNGGNAPTLHALNGEDAEQKMNYSFGRKEVALEAGSEARVPLIVEERRPWLGRAQSKPFQIHARSAGSSTPLTKTAEFVNKAVIPGWVLPVVGFVLVAALVITPFLVRQKTTQDATQTATQTAHANAATQTTLGASPSVGPSPTLGPSPSVGPSPTLGPSPSVGPSPTLGPSPGTFTGKYPTPTANSAPNNITSGPDGNLWFTEYGSNQIGRITPSGSIKEFLIPTASSRPGGITSGPDDSLWFTEEGGNKIGRITTNGVFTNEFTVPTASSTPDDITLGPDKNLWFTEKDSNKIGRITTSGSIKEFPIPTANSVPFTITLGPDKNLWFTEYDSNKIGSITPTGSIQEFLILTANSGPGGITSGPDSSLWFTEEGGNKIGRITTDGSFTNEFPIPTTSSIPDDITLGPDKNLWFTEYGSNQIGRITPSGSIQEFLIPTASSVPGGITSGPDSNLWFAENGSNQIGRISAL